MSASKKKNHTKSKVTPIPDFMPKQVPSDEDKYRIMVEKYDSMKRLVDWAFDHPVKFALGRIYHQYIKRDQKNV